MKKILFAAAAILWMSTLHAQPWMQPFKGKHVKLEEITERYEQTHDGQEADGDDDDKESREHSSAQGTVVKETKDYHFDRWQWYWQQHLDEHGYLVSPQRNFEEWQAYQQHNNLRNQFSKNTGTTASWTFQGPSTSPGGYNGIGRVEAVAFHPTDSNTYWVGTAGGGVWKTSNDGLTWTCLTDALPVLGISSIVCNPLNPNVLYICTGAFDVGDIYSIGVLKSTDGGLTWNTTGLQWTTAQLRLTNSIIINAADTSTLLVATSNGIYRTLNSGATWTQVQTGDFKQVMYKPGDTAIVYATGAQIYRSANGGGAWAAVTSVTGSTRVAIAVTPAAPNMIKAVFDNSTYGLDGVYSSTDTGHTFTKIYSDSSCTKNMLNGALTLSTTTCGGQAWYDLVIAISPVDTNTIEVGGVNTYRSANGGKTFRIANQWYGGLPGVITIHADKHFLGYQPNRPRMLFEGNDGGVYKTANPAGSLWNDLTNGMGITQFYRNAVSNAVTYAIGGAQDNGSKQVSSGGSAELTGGDGMNCEIDWSNPNVQYTASQYGSISRTMDGGTTFTNISNNIPGQPQGNWITPYILHPRDSATLIAGYDKIYITHNRGTTWSTFSPVFVSGKNLDRLAYSISDTSTVYAIVNNTIRVTLNSGVSWSQLTVPYTGNLSDIIVSPRDKQHILVTFSGYGATQVAEYDTVAGWRSVSGNLPVVPVNCIAIDTSNGTKYVGTDLAVYYMDTTMTQWAPYNTNLPAAEITDLAINYTTDEIWAATFGRGMWKSTKYDWPKVIVHTGIPLTPFANDVITIAPNPNRGSFTVSTDNKALIGQPVDVLMYDVAGRTAWRSNGTFDSGGSMPIQANGLTRGTYILEVVARNGMLARKKMVVL